MDLSVRDVCRLLQVPEKTVFLWIEEQSLPVQKVSSNYHFNRAELLEWATLRKLPISPEMFQQPDELASSELTKALQIGGVVFDVPGTDKATVLHSVVQCLPLPASIDRDEVWSLFMARESLSSTSIGNGIALPHPRHPLLDPGCPCSVTLCFPATPIPFGAGDGTPVHALFATIAPNARTHLHLVARLGLAARDPGIQKALVVRAGKEQILAEFQRLEASFAASQNLHNGQDLRNGGSR